MYKKSHILAVVFLVAVTSAYAEQVCVVNSAATPQIQVDKPCFFIEGATGVGKTTFVQLLEQHLPGITTVYEPVEKFTDVNGAGNILTLFFGDPARWTFATEVYIGLMHAEAVESQIKTSTASVMLVDRSMYADCYVYGKMAHQLGTMNLLEWEIYKQLISWIGKNTTAKARGFIYLKTTPQVALDRVRARNRAGEEEVPLTYQENLARLYNEWFIERKDISDELASIPVLCIDATQNFKDDPAIQRQCIDQVKAFMAQHSNQSVIIQKEGQ